VELLGPTPRVWVSVLCSEFPDLQEGLGQALMATEMAGLIIGQSLEVEQLRLLCCPADSKFWHLLQQVPSLF